MSAREDLYAYMEPTRSEGPIVGGLLDAFAHELAEKIREMADEHHATYSVGMRIAADFIDQEVRSI